MDNATFDVVKKIENVKTDFDNDGIATISIIDGVQKKPHLKGSKFLFKTLCYIWSLSKKMGLPQKLAIIKKSTFFIQSSWNLVKIIISWAKYFDQVSWRLDKKCGFFTNG